MILELFLAAVLCYLCYHYVTKWEHCKLSFRLNGPVALPIIGNVHQLMFKNHQGEYVCGWEIGKVFVK